MDFSNFTLKELAAFISEYLRNNGIDCILSGGACVTIYKNQSTQYFVEFPPPPPTISNDYIADENFIEARGCKLKLLTPLDCVKDRLCSYFYFNDEQCLDQAILVAKDLNINLSEIEKWAKGEGEMEKFTIFKNRYNQF